jgi:hypothetical protein
MYAKNTTAAPPSSRASRSAETAASCAPSPGDTNHSAAATKKSSTAIFTTTIEALRRRRLAHAPHEHDGDGRDDRRRERVHHDRDAEHVRRAGVEPGDLRGGAIVGGEPERDVGCRVAPGACENSWPS